MTEPDMTDAEWVGHVLIISAMAIGICMIALTSIESTILSTGTAVAAVGAWLLAAVVLRGGPQ